MKTIEEVRQFVKDNCPFTYQELKDLPANRAAIILKLAEKPGLTDVSAPANANESAITDLLYQEYENQKIPVTQEDITVLIPEFKVGQTVYYLADNRIVNAEVVTLRYTESNKDSVETGIEYWHEFGKLPANTFASKVELVLELIRQTEKSFSLFNIIELY